MKYVYISVVTFIVFALGDISYSWFSESLTNAIIVDRIWTRAIMLIAIGFFLFVTRDDPDY